MPRQHPCWLRIVPLARPIGRALWFWARGGVQDLSSSSSSSSEPIHMLGISRGPVVSCWLAIIFPTCNAPNARTGRHCVDLSDERHVATHDDQASSASQSAAELQTFSTCCQFPSANFNSIQHLRGVATLASSVWTTPLVRLLDCTQGCLAACSRYVDAGAECEMLGLSRSTSTAVAVGCSTQLLHGCMLSFVVPTSVGAPMHAFLQCSMWRFLWHTHCLSCMLVYLCTGATAAVVQGAAVATPAPT